LKGYGVIRPGEQSEGQQSAEQHHVGQLQPMRSESGAERLVEEAVLEALPPGGDHSTEPDEQRQAEHQGAIGRKLRPRSPYQLAQ
jgi:hypothetical protein